MVEDMFHQNSLGLKSPFSYPASNLTMLKSGEVASTPLFCNDNNDESPPYRQSYLDNDHAGFAFAPSHLLTPYKANGNDVDLGGKLFYHITNFVACNHGYHGAEQLNQLKYTIT
jgi:hypothetical protein